MLTSSPGNLDLGLVEEPSLLLGSGVHVDTTLNLRLPDSVGSTTAPLEHSGYSSHTWHSQNGSWLPCLLLASPVGPDSGLLAPVPGLGLLHLGWPPLGMAHRSSWPLFLPFLHLIDL